MWHNFDPRRDIYKRANIVILHPALSGLLEATVGHVETKNDNIIFTGWSEHPLIRDGESWDEAWYWAHLPETK